MALPGFGTLKAANPSRRQSRMPARSISPSSPDGRFIVTASDNHSARVWDASTGQPVSEPLLHLDIVKWAEFSPEGTRVVSASMDNTACIWDVRNSQAIAPRLQH